MLTGYLLAFFLSALVKFGAATGPGPKVIATKGEVWPKPQNQDRFPGYFVLRPTVFSFQADFRNCNILNDAITRYQEIITFSGSLERKGALSEIINRKYRKPWLSDAAFLGYIDTLFIDFDGTCDENTYPQDSMKENYTLNVTIHSKVVSSNSIWGILRGLETFSQLVHLANDEVTLIVNATQIDDYPRFGHRGLLIDTARHFIPLHTLLNMLDAMAYNKLNVFHWHLSDDQSFPYKSSVYPELSEYGAFNPKSKVYGPDDVQYVIEYARRRGVRVVPEFDSPGHTRSWGEGLKGLLPECYDSKGQPNGEYGPVDPTTNLTYSILEKFFEEIVEVFPDEFTHLGGDEVDFGCWKSNPQINDFMKEHKIDTYEDLEGYYIDKLLRIVNKLRSKSIVWQEVFVNGVNLPNDTLVHVWIDTNSDGVMYNVTDSGKPVLFSSCYYLDHLSSGGDWHKYYTCDPLSFNGTIAQNQLVKGGEACMWSEVVNEYNIAARIWPRASAVAERLWSDASVDNLDEAAKRLEEHACRMNNRGVGAQPPNGPGYCL